MAPTLKGKKKNRTLPLTVVGAQQAIPAGWRAQGASCLSGSTKKSQRGKGTYFYIAVPGKTKAVLVHAWKGGQYDGTITEWHSSKTSDAPRLSTKEVTDLVAQKDLDAMNLLVVKEHNKSFKVPPFFKGTWRGYLECSPGGPHVVLYRDLSYARVAIVSDLTPTATKGKDGKLRKRPASWEWAIVMNPRKSQEWFVTAKTTYSGNGKRSFDDAYHAAMKQLLVLMGEACTVKTVARADAIKRAKGQRKFTSRTKAGRVTRSTVRTKAARTSEVRKGRAIRKRPVVSKGAIQPSASIRALVGRKVKITNGIRGLRKDDLVKIASVEKDARGKVELLVHTIVQFAPDKGRLSKTLKRIPLYARSKGKNVRRISLGSAVNKAFDYALLHGLQNIAEVRKAKKAAPKTRAAKAAATRGPQKAKKSTNGRKARKRSYEKRVAAQRVLGVETRYIKFKGNRHKGRYARIDRVKPNASGNADPQDGGVLMEVVLISEFGGASKEMNEMTGGKRDWTKVTKAGYEAAKKTAVAAKKKADKKLDALNKRHAGTKPRTSQPVPTGPPPPPIPIPSEAGLPAGSTRTAAEDAADQAMADLDALIKDMGPSS